MAGGALLRAAVIGDAPALAAGMMAGLEEYPAFARPGWRAPAATDEEAHLRGLLADPDVWTCVAEIDARIAGQIMLVPADRASRPVAEPGLVHLRNLFVDRAYWGGGLAAALHAAAVAEARERGYLAMRLFVATGQERARHFYAREGWKPAGEPFHDPAPDLELIELRRSVS